MKITIVIPVFNEELRITKSLTKIINYCEKKFKKDYEIIIVDDGSNDKTRKIVTEFNYPNIILTNKRKNKGKGYSIKQGIKIAKGDLILFTDIDLSTPINELDKFLKLIEKYDIVIASRALKSSKVKTRLHKRILGRFSNFMISILIRQDIKDTQCGFKLFKKNVAKKLFRLQRINRWGFDFEILYLAQKYNNTIKEVGVKWIENENSKVKLKDYPKTLLELFSIKVNEFKGKY